MTTPRAPQLLVLALIAAGCGAEQAVAPVTATVPADVEAPPEEDLTEALFDPDQLIDVRIQLAPADWDALREEGRSLPGVFSGCARDYEYTYFRAQVTVDGQAYDDVAVRKKGYLGSLSTIRPSLKLNFGKFVAARTHSGTKRMTLNNNKQDPSNARQCMTYALFARAGAIAPRCNFARVTVNGADLGIYTHVESVKKPMLRRHFADDGGNLYEGQGADFVQHRVHLMELKTNEQQSDRSDLDVVTAALEVDDAELLDAVAGVIDLDAFLTFWAMEVLTGHWDSYSGGPNNYLAYHDPTSDLFYFVPWGADGTFSQVRPFSGPNKHVAVLAAGRVANRLYAHPDGRAAYFERLTELFEQLWDQDALLAEVDRIEELTAPAPVAAEAQRDAIVSLGTAMKTALEDVAAAPDWVSGPGDDAVQACNEDLLKPISGTFSTAWDSTKSPVPGQSVEVSLDGEPWQPTTLLGGAGLDSREPTAVQILMLSPQPSGRFLAVLLRMPLAHFTVGEHAMHGFETNVMILDVDPQTPGDARIIGMGGGGSVTLDTVSTTPGEPVSGHFQGEFLQIAPL